jgi:hypothetical protein
MRLHFGEVRDCLRRSLKGGASKPSDQNALRAFFVLFKNLSIASNNRFFHKTKNPPASWRTGLI